jgi:hypothetical protein
MIVIINKNLLLHINRCEHNKNYLVLLCYRINSWKFKSDFKHLAYDKGRSAR